MLEGSKVGSFLLTGIMQSAPDCGCICRDTCEFRTILRTSMDTYMSMYRRVVSVDFKLNIEDRAENCGNGFF